MQRYYKNCIYANKSSKYACKTLFFGQKAQKKKKTDYLFVYIKIFS